MIGVVFLVLVWMIDVVSEGIWVFFEKCEMDWEVLVGWELDE